jgi:hypothetical protein
VRRVPQVDVIAVRPTARHDDVEVVVDGVAGRLERLAARDAQIPLVLPPGSGQRLDRRAGGCLAGNNYVEVDDRLGVQAGDRCAADVLGHVRDAGQCGVGAVAQHIEQAGPARVVGRHHGGGIHVMILPQGVGGIQALLRELAACLRSFP